MMAGISPESRCGWTMKIDADELLDKLESCMVVHQDDYGKGYLAGINMAILIVTKMLEGK